jgi:hypothetical protein
LNADGEEHPVWIDWNAKKAKYWLVSSGLSRIKTKDNPKISLTRRFNQMQPFRIITRDLAHTYVGGDFYRLDLDLTDPKGAASLVLDLITAIPGLAAVTSEKGVLVDGHVDYWATARYLSFSIRHSGPTAARRCSGGIFLIWCATIFRTRSASSSA